jgi:hypothetical protein
VEDEEEAAEELFQRLYNNTNAEQLTPAQRNNLPCLHEKPLDCAADK